MANGISLSLLQLYEQTRGRNFKVVNNTVDGALSSGINVRMHVDNLEIANNVLRNCGQFEQLDDSYKVGIRIWGNLWNVKIKNNVTTDDQEQNTLKAGVHIDDDAVMAGEIELGGNTISAKAMS